MCVCNNYYNTTGPSHYLLHFAEDDGFGIVLRKVIVTPLAPGVGDTCLVKCSDEKKYTAEVIAVGKRLYYRSTYM